MSEEKDGDGNGTSAKCEEKITECCDNEESQELSTTQEPGTHGEPGRVHEFIDLHDNAVCDSVGMPVEESGEACNRTVLGGATVCGQQCVDSDDEYHSADDGWTDEKADLEFRTVSREYFVRDKSTPVQEECVSGQDGSVVGQDCNLLGQDDSVSGPERCIREDVSDTPQDGACGGGEEEDRDEESDADKPDDVVDDEEVRKKMEESLSDDEKLERKSQAQEHKEQGNQSFRQGEYEDAIKHYGEALEVCPLSFQKERSIMFSNRAACQMKLDQNDKAIASCTKALELHPHYMKPLLRRAELYEKADKLDEALADYQKAVELDPSQHAARHAALRLADQVKERNEKMKEEMLGKLKDLGNMILRPFGMSTENFKLQQDPNTGSYSVQFSQNQNQKQ